MSTFLRLVSALAGLVAIVVLFRAPIVGLLQSEGIEFVAFGSADQAPSGFMLQVRSEPAGGVVAVLGRVRGEAPLVANVECREGQLVVIEVAWSQGGSPWRQTVECRPGGSLWVRARKGAGEKPGSVRSPEGEE